jgi:hypothetical protein
VRLVALGLSAASWEGVDLTPLDLNLVTNIKIPVFNIDPPTVSTVRRPFAFVCTLRTLPARARRASTSRMASPNTALRPNRSWA